MSEEQTFKILNHSFIIDMGDLCYHFKLTSFEYNWDLDTFVPKLEIQYIEQKFK